MGSNPIAGKTLRWTYEDGPMKGKSFEHVFGEDGTVQYRQLDSKTEESKAAEKTSDTRYEVAPINDDVYAVSYFSKDSGYTLTTVVDSRSGSIASFASNDKGVMVQRGTLLRAKRAA